MKKNNMKKEIEIKTIRFHQTVHGSAPVTRDEMSVFMQRPDFSVLK